MKKSLILGFVMAFAFSLGARAETDAKAMAVLSDIQRGIDNNNQIKTLRVQTEVILPAGAIDAADLATDSVTAAEIAAGAVTTSEILDDTVGSADIGTIVQTYTDGAAIDVTLYAPAFVGQLLIDTTSNIVYGAKGVTTNDWIQLSN